MTFLPCWMGVAEHASASVATTVNRLYRLYTIILNDRLVAWTEEHGLRSPVQAGFRPRQSPILHLFALRHFIDRAILQQRPLFVSFVNLQKAYDTVQHGLLWARLEGIGVGPKMLAAIKFLNASGTLAMKVGGAAGPSLVQQNGLRQGCPLSPTLFGIFFDGLNGHLDRSLPHAGVAVGLWQMGVSSRVCRQCCLVVLDSWATGPSGQHACLLLELGAHHQPFQGQRLLSSMAAALPRGMLGGMFSLGLHPSKTWALSFMSLAA